MGRDVGSTWSIGAASDAYVAAKEEEALPARVVLRAYKEVAEEEEIIPADHQKGKKEKKKKKASLP
jgi:DNA recombination-dependent growth factor C